jgi:phosphohistidine phosphatase
MKTLYIARHAKAEPDADMGDFYRKLSLIGYREAALMGNFLAEKQVKFDAILASEAVRTHTTAKLFAEAVGFEVSDIQAIKELYDASVRTLMQHINELPNSENTVLLVGHNPYINYLAEFLGNQNVGSFDTATVVCITFEVENWAEISGKMGSMQWIKSPEM